MNCSDYDDGSPTRFSWGNQSYREYMGQPPYDDKDKNTSSYPWYVKQKDRK